MSAEARHNVWFRPGGGILPWTAAATVAGVHMMLFTVGYRLTPDDVLFLKLFLEGFSSVKDFTISLALEQGRIGQFFMMPLNAAGSYFVSFPLARILIVLLYFLNFLVFSIYVSVILRADVKLFLFILLVAMHPLAYEHMPPTSYPLQNTIPFFLMFVSRILTLRSRSRDQEIGGGVKVVIFYIAFAFSMLVTEFAFLLGTAMLSAEYLIRLADAMRSGQPLLRALLGIAASKSFRVDMAAVLAVFFAYVLFRWFNPSLYEGNSLDAILEIDRVLETTVGHIFAGTIFSRLGLVPIAVPWTVASVAMIAGLLTTLSLFASFPTLRTIRSPLPVGSIVIVMMIYVTLPLAANTKQQAWCVEDAICGYLDSRTSYYGVAVIVLCALSLLLRRLSVQSLRAIYIGAASLALGAVSALTYTINWQNAQTMLPQVSVWERATLLACYPSMQPESDARLERIIDPQRQISIYSFIPRPEYWKLYVEHEGYRDTCSTGTERQEEILRLEELTDPDIVANEPVRFSPDAGGPHLLSGWSTPEPWGVWSDGERATLILRPEGLTQPDASLDLRFNPYFGPSVQKQTISAFVNGEPAGEWTFSEDSVQECCRITIPLSPAALQEDTVEVDLLIRSPRDPSRESGSGETRRLGIGLTEMTLEQ